MFILLSIDTDTLYIIEKTVGFKTNIDLNAEWELDKCLQLTHNLSSMYHCIRLLNLSVSSLGIFGNSCKSFIEICKDLEVERQHMMQIIRKTTNIIIRSTYYIFCMRKKSGPTVTSLCISYMTRNHYLLIIIFLYMLALYLMIDFAVLFHFSF